MAKPWAEVEQDPAYQSLSDDDKETARTQYFDEVVAPQVETPDIELARSQFDDDTKPTVMKKAGKAAVTVGIAAKNILDTAAAGLEQTVTGDIKDTGPILEKSSEALAKRGVASTPEVVSDLKDVFASQPTHIKAAVSRARQNFNVSLDDTDEPSQLIAESDRVARESATKGGDDSMVLPGINRRDVREAGQNLSFSAASAGAGLGVGVPLGLVNPIAGWTGGTLTSGVVAGAQDANMFTRQIRDVWKDEFTKENGRPPTDKEWTEKRDEMKGVILKHAGWEAIPEAIGNLAGLKIIVKPLTKIFGKNTMVRLLGKTTGVFGTELATETVTQTGQTNAEIEAGVSDAAARSQFSPSDQWQSLKEVAPQVFLLTAMIAGPTAIASKAYDKAIVKPRDEAFSKIIKDATSSGQLDLIPEQDLPTVVKRAEEVYDRRYQDDLLGAAVNALKQEQVRRQTGAAPDAGAIPATDVLGTAPQGPLTRAATVAQQGLRALPAPTMVVTPEGVAATETQQQNETARLASMGITPDVQSVVKKQTTRDEAAQAERTKKSVADIHALAASKNIPWDNDPNFMAFTQEVTGKRHLDDLNPADLKVLYDALDKRPAVKLVKEKRKPTLRDAVVRLGGISTEDRLDITGDTKGNYNIPGVGHLFTPNGTSLDGMAENLVGAGWFSEADRQSGDATRKLAEMLKDEVAGVKQHYHPGDITAKMKAEFEQYYADQEEAERPDFEADPFFNPPPAHLELSGYNNADEPTKDLIALYAVGRQKMGSDAFDDMLERLAERNPDADDNAFEKLVRQEIERHGTEAKAQAAATRAEGRRDIEATASVGGQRKEKAAAPPVIHTPRETPVREAGTATPAKAGVSVSTPGKTADMFGGKSDTAQAVKDREVERQKKMAEAPPAESGEGDLFSGKARQTDIEDAAAQAATSPENNLPEPTEGQREAGNYKKGHISLNGLDISIENPEGSKRRPEWPALKSHYGYIKGTVGKDKDHIDIFIKPGTPTDYSGPVFVVDQTNKNGAFDEHKTLIGWPDEVSAREGYLENYTKGWTGLGAIKRFTLDEFKDWLKNGDTKNPVALEPKSEPRTAAPVAESQVQATEASEGEAATAPGGAPSKIEDVGEKIGGARKDLAESTSPRTTRDKSEVPGWRKRYQVSQIVKSAKVGEEGRWVIRDTRKEDWKGQARQIGESYATKEEAEAAIPLVAVARNHSVGITGDDKYVIWRKVTDRKRVKVVDQEFQTRDDAMRYMAQHAEEIIDTKTSFGEEILPIPDKVTREGAPRRTGNVTGDDFRQTYGFRAVEFGLWENQEERQQVMNHAYDALADLAEILNIPPRAIGLNGELALAFGARGHGLSGARAHYERDYGVINLTKMKGAGSLGHEWFHALDHYFGRQDTKAGREKIKNERGDLVYPAKADRSKDFVSYGFSRESSVRPEVRDAYNALIETIFSKAEKYVEDTQKADKFVAATKDDVAKALADIRKDLAEQKDVRYWKRNNKPASAEQLAEFDTIAEKLIAGEMLETEWRATGEKVPKNRLSSNRWTNDALDKISVIYKAVRGRSGFGSGQSRGVLDSLRGDMDRYSQRLKMLASAQSGETKTKKVPTSYAMEAKSIDQGRASEYWTTEHEMAARAFQAYVEDKITERGGRSDFLTYGTNVAVPTPWGWKRPFPHGEERKAINAAFDKLIGEIKTKETDQGTALFEPETEYQGTPALRSRGIPKEAATIHSFVNDQPLKAHADYKAAKAGDYEAAARLVRDLVKPENLEASRKFGTDAIFVPAVGMEATGQNQIPRMLAEHYAVETGANTSVGEIVQINKAYHTGAGAMERLIARPLFDGPVEHGGKYVLVDDVTTMGGTLAEMSNHIQSNGGKVVGVVTLVNAGRSATMTPGKQQISEIERRYGHEISTLFGIEPAGLTRDEATYILGFRDADALRNRASAAERQRSERLRAKGIQEKDVGSTGGLQEPKPQYADQSPTFYSALAKAIGDVKLPSAPASQWKSLIKNIQGIKQEEIDTLGLNEWLDEQEGSVTKEQVLDFLRANEVQVQEVTLGKDTPAEYKRRYDEITDLRDRGGQISAHEWTSRINYLNKEFGFEKDASPTSASTTKFPTYVLSGGKAGTYREMFLTLPERNVTEAEYQDALAAMKRNDNLGYDYASEALRDAVNEDDWTKVWSDVDAKDIPIIQRYVDAEKGAKKWKDGHSQYSEIVNPVYRIRFDIRDVNGKKHLHIAEMQTIAKSEQAKAPGYAQIWFTPKYGAMLAFKRALRYAVEQGVDVVSWDTGETQAARYDLSKQVDEISAKKRADNSYWVMAIKRSSGPVLEENNIPLSRVEELIGKDIASKIKDQDIDVEKSYSGLDLKVGGEGMKSFYDSILPNLVNRYVKKWGGKVGETSISPVPVGSDAQMAEYRALANEKELAALNHGVAVHSLDITPAMRESVMLGQSLFEPESEYTPRDDLFSQNATQEQKALAREALADLGTLSGNRRAKPRLLGSSIPAEFAEKGRISLLGQKAATPEDLAVIAQVYRDPRFETFRIFFMKGDTVVGQTGISSRLPGMTQVFVGKNRADVRRFLADMRATMEKLGADGYYLLHNHPSGTPTPSAADLAVTQDLARDLKPFAFKGHVVINENKYGQITLDASGTEAKTVVKPMASGYSLRGGKPVKPHSVLGMDVPTQNMLAHVAKQIQVSDGYFVLIGRSHDGVRGIMEVPKDVLKSRLRALAVVRKFAADTGSMDVFAAGIEESEIELARQAIKYNVLRDIIYTSGRHGYFDDVADRGYIMGRQFNRGMQAEETGLAYGEEPEENRLLRPTRKASMEQDASIFDHLLGGKFLFKAAGKLGEKAGVTNLLHRSYDAILQKSGEIMPESVKDVAEKIKAGVVSHYGLEETYLERKADMHANEAALARKSHGMIEILANLSRAEARVAYYWMQEKPDTATERELMTRLPETSRQTLKDLKQLISDLGREAVRLGQLTDDSFQRNNMAYLHRSYAKHVLADEGVIRRMLRSRALRIKGDQYKGRGIFEEVDMERIQNIAPDFWRRKLQKGQADTSLKGEKFIRFEKRDASGEVMEPLPGMTAKPLGKLRGVSYWPASEPVPARFGDWVNAGTWEVRGSKGDKIIMWRDLTKSERERLGELDEVRYAVAQTLQMMVHDIELGRLFEWVGGQYGKKKPEGKVVAANEGLRHAYGKGTWVRVPDTEIPGTNVKKYGALSGLHIPGPIWNDMRQIAAARYEPWGKTYAGVLRFWKKSKTSWSPGVHMNNIIANFVMADWHDIRSVELYDALKVWINRSEDGYKQLFERFEDSGALGGMFVSNELLRNEINERLKELKADLMGESAGAEAGNMAKLLQLVSLTIKPVKATGDAMTKAYQAEDEFFRLAVFLKAIRYGHSDRKAGSMARHSFLDYSINAPWVQALRHTGLPFISFFYRAFPMLLQTVKNKPWKVAKLMAFWSLLSALGYAMTGDDDEERQRKRMPEEKAGRVWGLVPKMIRLPWSYDGQPVFLDIRRWVPVGDIADLELGSGWVPPPLVPSGPLVTLAEVMPFINKSLFTQKEIYKDTDTFGEASVKVMDHLFKSIMPNVPVPNPIGWMVADETGQMQTYAWSGIEKAITRKENQIGEVRSLPQAALNTIGVKIGTYPANNMLAAVQAGLKRNMESIDQDIARIGRNYARLDQPSESDKERRDKAIARQIQKKREMVKDTRERMGQ